MVGSAGGAEPQAGHVPLPVLPRAAALDEGARARAARGRRAPAPARAHRVRAGREARGSAAFARPVARDAAEQTGAVLAAAREDSNPLSTKLTCHFHCGSLLSVIA